MNSIRSLVLVCLVILLLATSGCTDVSSHSGPAFSAQPSAASVNSSIVRVEVFHFHGNKQCAYCIAVGNLGEKTMNASFKVELTSGRIMFAHVNYDLPENAALKEKYGVTGSSLWIGVYDTKEFHKEQDIRGWSLINDEGLYSTYLSGIITRRLNGDFS
jgi:tricorn protease-like protein